MRRKVTIAMICSLLTVISLATVYLLFIAPKHWTTGADSVATGVDEAGNPWFGAAQPELTIHEFVDFDCPHCPEVHRAIRSAMVGKLDRIRLIRHDYARMACKPNDAELRSLTCEMTRAAICASRQIPYWKWNDRVMGNPRTVLESVPEYRAYVNETRDALGLDAAAFDNCLYAPDTVDRAHAIYEHARRLRINMTPVYIVNDQQLLADHVLEMIRAL